MPNRHSRYLILQFALTEFKIRYTHSLPGYAWSVLNPLVFTLIYFFVFSRFMRFNVPNYQCFLLLGIALWNFFSEGSTNAVYSPLARSGILSKVAMPRSIVVQAAFLTRRTFRRPGGGS
jgi:lipopolysaccharide transport system permease protein